jgi:hypothetical protein
MVATGLAAPAHAHLGHVVLRAERYLKLDVAGNRARVVVSLTLGAEAGRRVLAAADADGDGEVDPAEADAYLAEWGRGLADELPVRVDAEPVRVAWGEGYFDPVGPVRAVPVTVEMIARLELDGEQTVTIEDRMVRREAYDRTDVAFRARDGAELLASGADPSPSDVVEDLAYGASFRDGEPVTLTAVLRTPERPPAVPWGGVLAGVALLAAGVAVFERLRRRR